MCSQGSELTGKSRVRGAVWGTPSPHRAGTLSPSSPHAGLVGLGRMRRFSSCPADADATRYRGDIYEREDGVTMKDVYFIFIF